jgi:hypothetical protein
MTSTIDFSKTIAKRDTSVEAISACSALGWSAEVHALHGDCETIQEKLAVRQLGLGRRLFYLTIETAQDSTVFEFLNTEGEIYEVCKAETSSYAAQQFNQTSSNVIFQNKGRDCVGEIVQRSDAYSMLDFSPFRRGGFDPETSFHDLIPSSASKKNSEKSSCCQSSMEKPDESTFVRATVALLC